jgi:deazaflavin-dependent oxidoreductase (nitroreductase family)
VLRPLLILAGAVVLTPVVAVVALGMHDMAGSCLPDAPAATALHGRLARVAHCPTLRLEHRGRKSGNPYEVTIWFVVDGDRVYLTTMDVRRQWVRNVLETPHVRLRIGPEQVDGTVAAVTELAEKRHEYGLLIRKYWTMRLLDAGLRAAGRDPQATMDLGRGGFLRVDAD